MEKTTERRERIGKVTSVKMHKTIVVKVDRLVKHKMYKKRLRKITRFKVHDEKNTAKLGDTVKIQETRPLSKDKRWRLIKVVESAK